MKLFKKTFTFLLIGLIVLNCFIPVFALSEANSTTKSYTVDGLTFSNYSSVWVYNYGVQGRAQITAPTTMAAGYVGALAMLFDITGTLVQYKSFTTNSVASKGLSVGTDLYTASGTYRAIGQTFVYTNGEYDTKDTYYSPYLNYTATRSILDENTSNNEDIEDISVFDMEFIRAVGVDGTVGYVLTDDLLKIPSTPEEALAIQGKRSGLENIPLYDEDGETIIGTFSISPGDVTLW